MLPHFNERDDHTKLVPLTGPSPPGPIVEGWLARVTAGQDRSRLRVLDLGCGRGATVAWLLEEGFDAYGIDPGAEYIANGLAYLPSNRLAVLDSGRYAFPDDFFDIVISKQVFEHVSDLEQLAREVSRVSKSGAIGFHTFPAKWTIIEPHMSTPIVHWLPRGRPRRAAVRAAIQVGLAAQFFDNRPVSERTEIFAEYADNNIFYRPLTEIRRIFGSAGLSVNWREESTRVVRSKLREPAWPVALNRLAGWAYYNFRIVCLTTVKE